MLQYFFPGVYMISCFFVVFQFSDFIFHMQLRNLTAFTSYDIIVDLIPCNNGTREGFWSDHFNITVKTDDDG